MMASMTASTPGPAGTAKQLVAEAREQIENLGPEQLREELQRDDVVLVDLREQSERDAAGAIPGAVHVPRGLLEFAADPSLPSYRPELDPDRRIVLHCAVGGRSALAARTLTEMGYADVAHLDGGFDGWRDSGGAVERP